MRCATAGFLALTFFVLQALARPVGVARGGANELALRSQGIETRSQHDVRAVDINSRELDVRHAFRADGVLQKRDALELVRKVLTRRELIRRAGKRPNRQATGFSMAPSYKTQDPGNADGAPPNYSSGSSLNQGSSNPGSSNQHGAPPSGPGPDRFTDRKDGVQLEYNPSADPSNQQGQGSRKRKPGTGAPTSPNAVAGPSSSGNRKSGKGGSGSHAANTPHVQEQPALPSQPAPKPPKLPFLTRLKNMILPKPK